MGKMRSRLAKKIRKNSRRYSHGKVIKAFLRDGFVAHNWTCHIEIPIRNPRVFFVGEVVQ